MIQSTQLPGIKLHRHGPFAFEFFDLSWRFKERFIVGGQLAVNLDNYSYMSYFNYNSEDPNKVEYVYSMNLAEYRIYGEYPLIPLSRLFTRRTEFLIGGGIIISSPNPRLVYFYVPDPALGDVEYIENYDTQNILGAQIRSAFHYYAFPGFSLFAGVEGNFYQNLTMADLELPTNNTGVDIRIPEHKLQYSSFRIKVGASIYF